MARRWDVAGLFGNGGYDAQHDGIIVVFGIGGYTLYPVIMTAVMVIMGVVETLGG